MVEGAGGGERDRAAGNFPRFLDTSSTWTRTLRRLSSSRCSPQGGVVQFGPWHGRERHMGKPGKLSDPDRDLTGTRQGQERDETGKQPAQSRTWQDTGRIPGDYQTGTGRPQDPHPAHFTSVRYVTTIGTHHV